MSSNTYIFKLGEAGSEQEIAGQGDGTRTDIGTPVETTNKANGGARTFEPDLVVYDGVDFAVTFNLENDAVQNTIKAARDTGAQLAGTIEDVKTGESWTCPTWVFHARSDTTPKNTINTMSLTISTSGPYTKTNPTAA